MVTKQKLDRQLRDIGCNIKLWGRSEIRELRRVMGEDEVVKVCVNGHYNAGFAMLVATNLRLLMIDRKPLFLTIEAIWYDKIGQVDFSNRFMNATVCISTPNKELQFTSSNNDRMHKILLYTQHKMIEAQEADKQRQAAAQLPVPSGGYFHPYMHMPHLPEYFYHPFAHTQPQPQLVGQTQQLLNPTGQQESQHHLPWPKISEDVPRKLQTAALPYSRKRFYATS